VRFVPCDVTDLTQLKHTIDTAAAHFGGLDILFSNASRAGTRTGVENYDAEAWDATYHLLLRSVVAGASYAVPHMKARGGGAIVNTSSITALQAGYGPMAYSIAKAGVLHFTKLAAAELSAHNIRINAVVPGFIATNIFGQGLGMDAARSREIGERVAERSGNSNPLGRAGLPQDIAEAVLYLCSDAARFITGTHLTIDGGIGIGPRHAWDPKAPRPMTEALNLSPEEMEALGLRRG
jgi:NAD(P)-dependent dehydrogenase (short-subunit alcohol dehydrogenase family)